MEIITLLVIVALTFLTLGVFLGYFAYKVARLSQKLERVIAVLAQAGPNIAARIQEGGTKVVVSDAWHDQLDDQVITR